MHKTEHTYRLVSAKRAGNIAIETVSERSFPTTQINDSKLDSLKNIIIDNLTIFILYELNIYETSSRQKDRILYVYLFIISIIILNKLKYIKSF